MFGCVVNVGLSLSCSKQSPTLCLGCCQLRNSCQCLAGALLFELVANFGFRGCHARSCRRCWGEALLFDIVVHVLCLGVVMFEGVVHGLSCAKLPSNLGFRRCHVPSCPQLCAGVLLFRVVFEFGCRGCHVRSRRRVVFGPLLFETVVHVWLRWLSCSSMSSSWGFGFSCSVLVSLLDFGWCHVRNNRQRWVDGVLVDTVVTM